MENRPAQVVRFGAFEADLRAGELRRQGIKVKLQEQPFQVLSMLLERPGEVVTRDELRERLWPGGTFVDFDHSLNAAINRLREALGDSADNPRFVETLPRRGYRFVAPVAGVFPTAPESDPNEEARSRLRPGIILAAVATALALIASYLALGRYLRPSRPDSSRVMLAVLPFENLSGDPAEEYFSDGLTEEMIVQLSRIEPERLGVIARTSSMRYKASPKPIDEVARELKVQYVVEGSARRIGDRVRITAQLVQTSDQTHLWAESYERDIADVLAIQSDVAHRIAHLLALELLPGATPAPELEAYEAYLKGRYHWNKRTGPDMQRSVQYFRKAIEEDPSYALAYVGLADAYNVLPYYGLLPPRDAFRKSKESAQRALELDGSSAEAHTSLAYAHHYFDWDWASAEREYRRATELNPNYGPARQWYAAHLVEMGRVDDALAEMQKARQLDPLSLIINAGIGWIQYHGRRYEEATAQLRDTLLLDPDFVPAHLWLGQTNEQTGRFSEAIDAFQRTRELSGDAHTGLGELAHGYALAGEEDKAREILDGLLALSRERYVEADLIARVYVGLGDHDEALRWLERGYEERAVKMVLLGVDPQFDPLRGNPRFQELLARIDLPRRPPAVH